MRPKKTILLLVLIGILFSIPSRAQFSLGASIGPRMLYIKRLDLPYLGELRSFHIPSQHIGTHVGIELDKKWNRLECFGGIDLDFTKFREVIHRYYATYSPGGTQMSGDITDLYLGWYMVRELSLGARYQLFRFGNFSVGPEFSMNSGKIKIIHYQIVGYSQEGNHSANDGNHYISFLTGGCFAYNTEKCIINLRILFHNVFYDRNDNFFYYGGCISAGVQLPLRNKTESAAPATD